MTAVVAADLFDAIRRSWAADTSVDGEWSPERASRGQCAVTALLIQDVYGGQLIRATVGDVSHYWNLLPGGEEIDLTRSQFDSFDPVNPEIRERAFLLADAHTAARYRLLAERVRRLVEEEHPGASTVSA